MPQIIKLLMNLGQMKTATQSLTDDEVELIAAELGREVTIKHAGEEDAEPETFEDADESLVDRPAGRHDHGPRRPRQDDAPRRDPQDGGRRDRGRRHHAAHRRVPDRRRRPEDHVPRHAGPRGVHGHARPRREGRPTSRSSSSRPTTASCRRRASRSRTRARPRCRSSSPSTRSTCRTRTPTACSASSRTEGLQPEEWGGTTQVARVSAKQGENLDELLEKILLVADIELEPAREPERRGVGPDHRVAPRRRPRPRRDDARPPRHAQGRRRDRRRRRLGPRARALRLPRRARPGGAPGRAGRDPRLRQAAARRRDGARRREGEPRPRARAPARRAAAPRGAREAVAAAASRSRRSSSSSRPAASPTSTSSSRATCRDRSRRSSASSRRSSTPRCACNVIHTGVGGITENDVNLAAASHAMVVGFNVRPSAEARAARRAAGDRDPPVPRHLPAHRGDRAGARRDAEAGRDRGDPRRGRGARALQGLARSARSPAAWSRAASSAAARTSGSSARARASTRRRSRSSSGSRRTCAR